MTELDFDFDRWSELARQDPEAFFKARSEEIERFIGSREPAERKRLRDMQRRIDCTRAKAGSPAKALRCLAFMMQERLILLNQQSEALQQSTRKLKGALLELELLR